MHLPGINVLDVMKAADRLKARRCREAGFGLQLVADVSESRGRSRSGSQPGVPTKGQLHGGAANWQSRPKAAVRQRC